MPSCVVMGKSIGHKIAILLAERRWRNTDLAVASGISLPTIGRWINDTHETKKALAERKSERALKSGTETVSRS